jgi:hypothetical protein
MGEAMDKSMAKQADVRGQFFACLVCLAAALAIGSLTSIRVAGQMPARAAAVAKAVTSTADGHPDLQGVYNTATITPLERPAAFDGRPTVREAEAAKYAKEFLDNADIDRREGGAQADVSRAYNNFFLDRGTQLARVKNEIRTSLVVDPPDGKLPPLTPEGEKRAAAARGNAAARPTSDTGENGGAAGGGAYDNPEQRPLGERCLLGFGSTSGPPALPVLYNNFKQIVQTPDHVMILNEMVHDVRLIRMGGEHLPSTIRRWMGDSVGHWEGDTLVVDTTNFTDKTSFRGSSRDLHVVERFARLDANTLLYRFTVDDPSTWTRPWTAEYPWVATTDRLFEYACHEANYALGDILRGARGEEKEAAGQAAKR